MYVCYIYEVCYVCYVYALCKVCEVCGVPVAYSHVSVATILCVENAVCGVAVEEEMGGCCSHPSVMCDACMVCQVAWVAADTGMQRSG